MNRERRGTWGFLLLFFLTAVSLPAWAQEGSVEPQKAQEAAVVSEPSAPAEAPPAASDAPAAPQEQKQERLRWISRSRYPRCLEDHRLQERVNIVSSPK
jgi:hypothetical protein